MATRPWQHVLDPISGYLKLAKSLYNSEIREKPSSWNFGPNTDVAITTVELARRVLDILGDGSIVEDPVDGPHEAGLLQLNCDKANLELGWNPRWNGTQAIEITAEWYRKVLAGGCPRMATKSDIEDYFHG